MILSILVPTLPESQNYLNRLKNILDPQIARHAGKVELIINDAPRIVPTGTKRNNLIQQSTGEYFVQVDCDDTVPMYYVAELLRAIEKKPDVVTFRGHMMTNGMNKRDFTIKLGEKYEERDGHYYRYPNHLCAFRREAVKSVSFQNIWFQEDYLWATEIKNKGLLKTEVHIPLDMYCYDYKTKVIRNTNSLYSRARQNKHV